MKKLTCVEVLIMRFLPLLSLLLCLVGCHSSPRMPDPLGLAYLEARPLRLNVGRVEVVKKYEPSSKPPHIENDLPVPPTAMIQQWTQDRLIPIGKTGYAVVTIEEASVTEKALKRTRGMQGFFTVDQSEQYEGRLFVKVEVFDEQGNAQGSAYARAQGSQTVPENITLGQRRKIWIHMMENIMNKLDEELDRNLKTHLGQYIAS